MLTLEQKDEKARRGEEQDRQIRALLAARGALFVSNQLTRDDGTGLLTPIFAEWTNGRDIPGTAALTVQLGGWSEPRPFSKVHCSFGLSMGTPEEAAVLAPLIVKITALVAEIKGIIGA